MNRCIATLFLLASYSVLSAQIPGSYFQEYYGDPCTWAAGDTLRHSVPDAFSEMNAHLRVKCKADITFDFSLVYNYRDSLNYSQCRLRRETAFIDELVAAPLTLETFDVRDGIKLNIGRDVIHRGLDASLDEYSMRMIVRRSGAVVSVAQKKELFRKPVSVDCTAGGEMLWVCGGDMAIVRRSMAFTEIEPPAFGRFADKGELDDYLSISNDRNEGYWAYFDRDTDQQRISLGGDYILATVRSSGSSAYEIIYISGARSNSSYWKPMQLKGTLKSTGFVDHYDLEWIDASGEILKRDTSADIIDGASITFYFPLYGGKVRFRKLLRQSLTD